MDWDKAVKYLKEVIDQYKELIGKPMVNPFFGLAFLDSLLKRYNQGERTQELYDAMMGAE